MYLQNKKPCSCFRKQEQVEYQNFVFSWNIIFMSGIYWSELVIPQHWSSTQGSMGSYSTVLVYPLWLASRGWSSPAILPPQDWTENLTVNSPTLSTTKPSGWWYFMSECGIAQDVQDFKKFQKFKIQIFVNIRIRTQYLVVVCVAKRLIPLDQWFLYRNNKSENINLIRHHHVSHIQKLKCSVFSSELGFWLGKNWLSKFFSPRSQTHFQTLRICYKLFKGCWSICAHFQVLNFNINKDIQFWTFIYILVSVIPQL